MCQHLDMNHVVMLIQSRSGMIHVEGCAELDHDTGSSTAVRVRRDEIGKIGPYSRCTRCAPPVPESSPNRSSTPRRAGALTHDDLGRETVLGRIEGIRHHADEVQVSFDHATTWSFAPTDHLSFFVPLDHRRDDDVDDLENRLDERATAADVGRVSAGITD